MVSSSRLIINLLNSVSIANVLNSRLTSHTLKDKPIVIFKSAIILKSTVTILKSAIIFKLITELVFNILQPKSVANKGITG